MQFPLELKLTRKNAFSMSTCGTAHLLMVKRCPLVILYCNSIWLLGGCAVRIPRFPSCIWYLRQVVVKSRRNIIAITGSPKISTLTFWVHLDIECALRFLDSRPLLPLPQLAIIECGLLKDGAVYCTWQCYTFSNASKPFKTTSLNSASPKAFFGTSCLTQWNCLRKNCGPLLGPELLSATCKCLDAAP